MNIYLEKVKEFMLTFGQPVLDKPTELPEDRQELRIKLIFEELTEYAEASGKLQYFSDLCFDHSNIDHVVENINQVEQFDALLDLQYVLSGAVHEHGFGEIFDEGFDEVHKSNMSKADDNSEDALITLEKYAKDGIETYFFNKNENFVHYRKEDNKVLKSHKYSPANLKPILDGKS